MIFNYNAPSNINLAESDDKILHIENVIEAKRNMLLNKQKQFKSIKKQNHFLDAVKTDYEKYYNYISKQKTDQIKALEILNSYIHDLTTSGNLTKHNIEDAVFEQQKIIREINTIKKGLDSIMNDANIVNSNLKR